jgi:hypothetical protein
MMLAHVAVAIKRRRELAAPRWTEDDWKFLLGRIGDGRCTPFLGAGVAHGILPLGGELAERLSQEYDYPLGKSTDLIRVAQYVAINSDPMHVKEKLSEMVEGVKLPARKDPEDEPHRLLAKLPLPIYLTTNYDDLMLQALRERRKDPVRDLCRWTEYISEVPSVFDAAHDPPYKPSVANPLVFHLHGHAGVVESLVVTEDDYLEFLGNISQDKKLIPSRVAQSLAATSLLFIGYQLADWNFRVILRGLARRGYTNYAVMPPPGGPDEAKEKMLKFLTRYYGNLNIRMYWGTAKEFLSELFAHAGNSFD